jgi:hypothetical protein
VSKRYEFELGPMDPAAPYPTRWSQKQPDGTLVSGPLTSSTEADTWQHVVLVRNTVVPGTSTYALKIGRNLGGIQRFRGLIDEVRIYARVLSEAEIQALYTVTSRPG